MLESSLLILTPLLIVDTILLFVIANRLTDGRCWEVTKQVVKWSFAALCSFAVVGVIAGLMVNNWEKIQTPLIDVGEVVALLLGAWAFFEAVRHAIVRPFLKGLRGREPR